MFHWLLVQVGTIEVDGKEETQLDLGNRNRVGANTDRRRIAHYNTVLAGFGSRVVTVTAAKLRAETT